MKTFLSLITYFFLITNSYGFTMTADWNPFFEKEVSFNCSEGDYFCQDYCGKSSQCIVKENFCRNCIGSDTYLTYIFNYVGKTIVRSDIEVTDYELLDFVKKGNFSTISAKSIYNHVERFDGSLIKRKFQALCAPYQDEYPLIVYNVEKTSHLLKRPEFIVCNDPSGLKVFKVGKPGDGVETSFIDESNNI